MRAQDPLDRNKKWFLVRVLSIPFLALLLALVLIYTRSLTTAVTFPEIVGGENFRRGLRTIAILFGLSCLPGGLAGVALGSVIVRNAKLASALLHVFRIGQWVPFVASSGLAPLLLVPPGQREGRYFFVWTMCVPAVVLGTCYHFLCTRFLIQRQWSKVISKVAKGAILRALLISLIVALSVWTQLWAPHPEYGTAVQHYLVFSILALFLIIVNWVYRCGIEHNSTLRREIFLAEMNRRDGGSCLIAALIGLLFFSAWELLNTFAVLRASLLTTFKAAAQLFFGGEIWSDMGVSLLEILAGLIFVGGVSLILSTIMSTNSVSRRVFVSIIPLTFIAPIVVLPAWIGWPVTRWQPFTVWTASCVAVFCFFPFLQTFWAMRNEPLFCKILMAAEDALPYAFAGVIYGEMMKATAGLGFAMVVAAATFQLDKGLAVFLLTLFLLLVLTFTVRQLYKNLYTYEQKKHQVHNEAGIRPG